MKRLALCFTALFSLSLAIPALADQRPDHYKGLQAKTLPQALTNFSEYNQKLSVALAKETLSPQDLDEIHQLTYTLENALGKIRGELADLEALLEDVHLASETSDAETVKRQGAAYLSTARQIVK